MGKISKTSRLVLGLVLLVTPWAVVSVPNMEYYLDILVFAGIYSLIAMGLSLLMGYTGQISLGHAGFFGLGAYASAILTATYGLNTWLAMALGMLLSAAVAWLVGMPSLKLRGHYLAMATLGFGIIVFIILNEETEWTGGPDGMGGIPGVALGSFRIDTAFRYYYLVWGLAYLAFLFSVNVIQSRAGRALRAIHTSEAAAASMGIDVASYKVRVFVLSAVFASLAGSLYAHFINFVNPTTFDFSFSVKLLIMITVGGFHSIFGAILGAVVITFLSMEWLRAFEDFELVLYGIVLLVFVTFLPEGLVGIPMEINKVWLRWKYKKIAKRAAR